MLLLILLCPCLPLPPVAVVAEVHLVCSPAAAVCFTCTHRVLMEGTFSTNEEADALADGAGGVAVRIIFGKLLGLLLFLGLLLSDADDGERHAKGG